jgi:hypothetical protein
MEKFFQRQDSFGAGVVQLMTLFRASRDVYRLDETLNYLIV